jgi:hypothetical protein
MDVGSRVVWKADVRTGHELGSLCAAEAPSDPHVKFACDCELKRFGLDSDESSGAVSTTGGLIRPGEIG